MDIPSGVRFLVFRLCLTQPAAAGRNLSVVVSNEAATSFFPPPLLASSGFHEAIPEFV